jgi:hypothetical protein
MIPIISASQQSLLKLGARLAPLPMVEQAGCLNLSDINSSARVAGSVGSTRKH